MRADKVTLMHGAIFQAVQATDSKDGRPGMLEGRSRAVLPACSRDPWYCNR